MRLSEAQQRCLALLAERAPAWVRHPGRPETIEVLKRKGLIEYRANGGEARITEAGLELVGMGDSSNGGTRL